MPRSPPHYLRFPPESGPGLASSGPAPSALNPGPHTTPTAPRLGLRSPGSPCRTASSAPPPTCCLPPSGLPPGPSEPEGPRKRQVSGRHQPPARLSGPLRHRLRSPQASSARPGAHLQNTARRPRISKKASQSPQNEVGQKRKILKRDKAIQDKDLCPKEGAHADHGRGQQGASEPQRGRQQQVIRW